MKLRKGDTVQVMLGKDKGKQGAVERVYEKSDKVMVKDMNKVKKHMRKSESLPQGGIVEVSRPMLASKVILISPSSKKRTRFGLLLGKDCKKRRVCKQCSKVI